MQRYLTNQRSTRCLRIIAVLGMLLGMLAPVLQPRSASAASVVSAMFLPAGPGSAVVGNTVYAKSGATLNLRLTTTSDTECVEITGSHTLVQHFRGAPRTDWLFPVTVGTGEGVKSITATAFKKAHPQQDHCIAQQGEVFGIQSASYIVDNTAPVVTGAVSPAANAAGWHKTTVSITWSATDTGSGVATGPSPATDSVTADTTGITKSATATDRVGNPGSGSVTVMLDKTAPTITGSRNPAANANGWNNTDVTVSFICSDATSGIKTCSAPTTLTGTGANQSAAGTAVDNADNSANATVSGVNIDKVDPTLSGVPATAPNAAGWYKTNVTINWTATDNLSGFAATPTPSTISTEGEDLTATASVSDRAGNSTSAISSPAVKIDKTAPTTGITGASNNWTNGSVTVNFAATDNLSGVASTTYSIDGGPNQNGTSFTLSTEGDHTVTYFSTDRAGNVEAQQTASVRIDQTAPTINHTFSPATYTDGTWTNGNVTVTFNCADQGGSGVASCTSPVTKTLEGEGQQVVGTATDNAGNSSTDTAIVSIDKTAPTISGAPDRAANAAGWYKDDVTISFAGSDALSGLDTVSAPVVLGEGANQSAPGTATDRAGNSANATVSGINIDKTAPTLTGAATPTPNAFGWYNGDVTINWTASDGLSGLVTPTPTSSVITGEGDNLSASASVSDKAGNSTSTTVSGIKIDRRAPNTSASVPTPLASGWYAGPVQVTLSSVDNLSTVDKTYYKVDNGAAQEYTAPFSHALPGVHTITFWSVDKAGNIESNTAADQTITLKIDNIDPTIEGMQSPSANTFGWNNSDVTVSFDCADAESGIAGCSSAETLSNEGAGQSATGHALDNAGNTATATVSPINIDKTAPTLTGAATTNPNASGWYKNNVTIAWTGQDGLSGIDPATQPANSVITGEGSNLGAGPASIYDKAGNVGSGSVSGIKIDRTVPTISGATVNDNGTPRSPNGAGWFNSAVRVRFTCGDALSGVQECASDVVLSTNGASQSAQGTATDRANNSASTTLSGINIDNLAPTTGHDLQCDSRNGWCRGNTATLVLTAVDQAGLSGVSEIQYKVGNAAWQSATGTTATVNVPLNGSGRASVLFKAKDNAGNVEQEGGVSIKYDNVSPIVSIVATPAANAAGWHNSDMTINFTAVDEDTGSGVESLSINGTVVATASPSATPTTLAGSLTITAETSGQTVTGSATDFAGNPGSDSVTIKLDKTAPTISGTATTSPNAVGWYKTAVTVHFTCGDTRSGVAVCPADVMLSTDGSNQSVTRTATDNAGNTASVTVSGINIDTTAPSITVNGIANGGIYTLGAAPAGSCSATDTLSGVAGTCGFSVTGGTANGVGTFNFTATATDRAGNSTTVSGSYTVTYKWDGFLQPINDTAHQIDQNVSIFKGGSTVPVKFQLKKADGTVIQASSAPLWLTPAKGGATSAPVDESIYSDPATSGSTYRWDATALQYIYNWGTRNERAGYYYRIGVRFDDGQTYYVNIGLR